MEYYATVKEITQSLYNKRKMTAIYYSIGKSCKIAFVVDSISVKRNLKCMKKI